LLRIRPIDLRVRPIDAIAYNNAKASAHLKLSSREVLMPPALQDRYAAPWEFASLIRADDCGWRSAARGQ
jgi:hypothetical protein